MSKFLFLRSAFRLALFIPAALVMLSACTPPVAGPSAALKQQFSQLQQQQRQQAEQLQLLQQQLAQLQQQAPGYSAAPARAQESPLTEMPLPIAPETIPSAIRQEVTALADSASSYLAAFSSLAAGRYAAAEAGFNSFLASYPEHQYSPNARYWLASSQVSQGKLQPATSNLRQLIVARDGQHRAPAALLLLARVYQQQNLHNQADEVFEQLRSRYPESSEAQQILQIAEPQQQL